MNISCMCCLNLFDGDFVFSFLVTMSTLGVLSAFPHLFASVLILLSLLSVHLLSFPHEHVTSST